MKSRKVIIVDATLRSLPYDYELIKALSRFYVVELWSSESKNYEFARNIFLFRNSSKLARLINIHWLYVSLLWHALKSKDDVIHFQWLPLIEYGMQSERYLLLILSKLKKKLIFTAHNVDVHEDNRTNITKNIYNLFYKIIIHNNYSFNVLTKTKSLSREKLVIIPHGLLSDCADLAPSKSLIRENKYILLFGGLRDYKGIKELLNAWNRVECKNGYYLVIAGKDMMNFRKTFTNSVNLKDTIVIDKFLEEGELNDLLYNAKYVIFPYKKISMSGALLKAIYAEKICVVTNLLPFTEIIKDNYNGFVIDSLETENFSRILTKIVHLSNDDTARVVQNVKQTKYDYPTWNSISLLTRNIYEN